jgi:hypothetical protein
VGEALLDFIEPTHVVGDVVGVLQRVDDDEAVFGSRKRKHVIGSVKIRLEDT